MRVIVSPHLDDAVLSLGQFMATEPCLVVTVFAGIPPKGTVSDYDRSCGFESSHQAVRFRRQEDDRALAVLGASGVHWDLLDGQYGQPAAPITLRAQLTKLLGDTQMPFVPLGLGHPDHRAVANACHRVIAAKDEPQMLVYEELPYRVQHPEEVFERMNRLRDEGWQIGELVEPLAVGGLRTKKEAIAKYASQFPEVRDPALFVPERVWRMWR